MYYIPLILMTGFSIRESKSEKYRKLFFYISLVLLTVMVCFRYGQGTDYIGYLGNYYGEDNHDEIGYYLISKSFMRLGVSFEIFSFLIALLQMLCVWRVVRVWSGYSTLSLLLLYPTIFLTYLFAGGRQGTVMVFFLAFMISWLNEDKWIRYLIACVLLCTIHSMAIILVPLVLVKKVKVKWFYVGIGIAAVAGCIILVLPASAFSFIRIGAVQYYIQEISFSWYGFAERIVLFAMLTFLYWKMQREGNLSDGEKLLYKIYCFGFVVTVIFFPWAMLSSRLGAPMKAVEILLLPLFLKKSGKYGKWLLAFLILYVWAMTTKNLLSYIAQGGYTGCNPLTYPWITIWNRHKYFDDILLHLRY